MAPHIGSCSQWQKLTFPNSQFREQEKLSPFCHILTELYHSKLYFCIPKFEMCLLANQKFYFSGYLKNILYTVSFSQFGIKQSKNFPIFKGRVMFPKWGEKPWIVRYSGMIPKVLSNTSKLRRQNQQQFSGIKSYSPRAISLISELWIETHCVIT